MVFRSTEVGQRLRAYRLAAGLSADALGQRLNMSRATVYRLEASGVARLDTLARIAALLEVPTESLLGVGVEYVPSALAYFERLRQIEEAAEHVFVAFGPVVYLLTSDGYDQALRAALLAQATAVTSRKRFAGEVDRLMEILAARKRQYRQRQPAITNVLSLPELVRFAETGLGEDPQDARARAAQRGMARRELQTIAGLLEAPPIGVQIGILFDELPATSFSVIRGHTSTTALVSPFRLGARLNVWRGIGMISNDPTSVALHSGLARDLWKETVTGSKAAHYIRSKLLTLQAPMRRRAL